MLNDPKVGVVWKLFPAQNESCFSETLT